MKSPCTVCWRCGLATFIGFFVVLSTSFCFAETEVLYDIVYMNSDEIERVLDYKHELERVFDEQTVKHIMVMGKGSEYALIYDANVNRRRVSKLLKKQSATLVSSGFDEPYALRDNFFHPLYNIQYSRGRDLAAMQKLYAGLYPLLKPEVRHSLYIEQGGDGVYSVVYQLHGERARADAIIDEQQHLATADIKPVRVVEEGDDIVYGESSHINDDPAEQKIVDEINRDRRGRLVLKARKVVKHHLKVAEGAVPVLTADRHKVKCSPGSTVRPAVAVTRPVVKKAAPAVRSRSASVRGGTVSSGTHSALERSIQKYINGLRRKGRIRGDEATGWMVYDLQQNESVVDINAEKPFQAASMIKPFVALAFFHKVKDGELRYGKKARRKLALMIQRSNNRATNWVMRQVGGPAACDRLLHKYYHKTLRNIHIREYIPVGGRTYKNTASPADYVRFLRELWDNRLPYSKEIRRLMALPGRDRIYNGTPIPRGTLVFNKTGSTARLIGDMGILVPKTRSGRRYPYIVVGVIQRQSRAVNYAGWMSSRGNIIRDVSTLVYKDLKRDHQLR